MTKLPKISIITPSFNQGQYLERTIRSVIDQNYPNLEFILLDAASTDNSLNIIKKYQKRFTYWRSKKDKGQSAAIEEGLTMATGDILAWLNSDDILLPYSLNLVAQIFTKYKNINWLTSQHISVNSDDQIIQTGIHTGKIPKFVEWGWYHGKALGFIPQEGTFWTKNLWQKSGQKMGQYWGAMDYHLWTQFAHHADLVSLETPLAAFRVNPSQKTTQMQKYYQEINPLINYIPGFVGYLPRILHPLILRSISPRIIFDKKKHDWLFIPGPFYRPGLR